MRLGKGQLKSAVKSALEVLVLTTVFFLLVEVRDLPQQCNQKLVGECFAPLMASRELVIDLGQECGGVRLACYNYLKNGAYFFSRGNESVDAIDVNDYEYDQNYGACLCLYNRAAEEAKLAPFDASSTLSVVESGVQCDFRSSQLGFFIVGLIIAIWMQLWSEQEDDANEIAYLLSLIAMFFYGLALYIVYGIRRGGCESVAFDSSQRVITALSFAFIITASVFIIFFMDLRRTKRLERQRLENKPPTLKELMRLSMIGARMLRVNEYYVKAAAFQISKPRTCIEATNGDRIELDIEKGSLRYVISPSSASDLLEFTIDCVKNVVTQRTRRSVVKRSRIVRRRGNLVAESSFSSATIRVNEQFDQAEEEEEEEKKKGWEEVEVAAAAKKKKSKRPPFSSLKKFQSSMNLMNKEELIRSFRYLSKPKSYTNSMRAAVGLPLPPSRRANNESNDNDDDDDDDDTLFIDLIKLVKVLNMLNGE